MAWELLGEGGVLDAGNISGLLSSVPNNTRVLLQLDLRASPAGWMVTQIQNALASAGIPGVQVCTGSPVLNISWLHETGAARIAMDPLTLVAIIIVALAVIALLIIGWRLYEAVPSGLRGPLVTIALVAGIALLAATAYQKFRA